MVGDSMGATAALLFSPLATAVQVFSPQVRLDTESVCDIAHYCYRIHWVLPFKVVMCHNYSCAAVHMPAGGLDSIIYQTSAGH